MTEPTLGDGMSASDLAELRAEMHAQLAEMRHELMLLRLERAAERKAAGNPPVVDDVVSVNAAYVWDPRGDDLTADYSDGKEHPDEAAIKDVEADHEAKASAWNNRAERLRDEGEMGRSNVAMSNSAYHDDAKNDSPRERRERNEAEKAGRKP